MESQQKRVMLWAVPRSCSTAICRAMVNSGYKTKIIFEPFVKSYFAGRKIRDAKHFSPASDPSESYQNTKKMLEMKYEEFELVFTKDISFTLAGQMKIDALPQNYTHTFIIRNPRQSITSLYDLVNSGIEEGLGWERFDAARCGFKEMVQMVRLFQQHGQKIIIMDSDDVLENPEAILRAYCREVGLTFVDSMVNWNPMSRAEAAAIVGDFGDWPKEWFSTLLRTSVLARTPKKLSTNDVNGSSSCPEELKQAIDDALPHYEELWILRLKP